MEVKLNYQFWDTFDKLWQSNYTQPRIHNLLCGDQICKKKERKYFEIDVLVQLIVGRPPRSVCNSHRSLRSYILHWWTAAPPPPPLPFWTGATFNPIANSIKTFPARTPFTSCKQCWNRSLVSIYSAWMFKSDQQISRKVQIDKNEWNIFFEIGINYIEYDWAEVIWCSI